MTTPRNPSEITRLEEDTPITISIYQGAVEVAMEKLRKWLAKEATRVLPKDPWQLPADCPVWHCGLSALQASVAVERVRRELDVKQS